MRMLPSSASMAMFCLGAALFGGMILLPYYWQQVRLESVVNTGLLTAPQGLGAALAMPIAGKLSDRLGGGPLALFGVIVTTVMTIPFALIGAHTSVVWLSFAMFLRGTAIGFAFMPAMAAAFADGAADAGAEVILLDNMDAETMAAAVRLLKGRALTEASGGITLKNVRAVAETGVDLISSGALTHSASALDLGLDFD